MIIYKKFSSPFIEERLYLTTDVIKKVAPTVVLVPFYRGAVVFGWKTRTPYAKREFSSPFIEERLYLTPKFKSVFKRNIVLVPFYRGAVVFRLTIWALFDSGNGFSSPFIEERLYL